MEDKEKSINFNSLEIEFENQLRPRSFSDFAGQKNVISNLEVFVEAANRRGEGMDHVLLYGPPGLGKTTLANIIANELNSNLKITSGPVLDKPGDLAGLLTSLEDRDVLFIDEIHRLSTVIEEYLYSAMEDFRIDVMIESGPSARSVQINLNHVTLIGATTRAGLLSSPLRDRFGIVQRLNFYDANDLTKICNRSAGILDLNIEPHGSEQISERARGTPRIVNRLLRRVRDYAEVKADGIISKNVAVAALDMLEVDPNGFDPMDRKLLLAIIEKFDGGPVGIESLSAALGEERGTIEDVIEPFLIQQGFLMRTSRGRVATKNAYLHFGVKYNDNNLKTTKDLLE